MAKYFLGTIAVAVLLAVGAFLIMAQLNDSRAETKPATQVTITVAPTGIKPREFEVERGRAVEITVLNRVDLDRTLELDSPDVEQLSGFIANRAAKTLPAFYIDSKAYNDASASARFTKPGTYELRLTGFQLADEIIKVIVK
jgi:hypothetical protein